MKQRIGVNCYEMKMNDKTLQFITEVVCSWQNQKGRFSDAFHLKILKVPAKMKDLEVLLVRSREIQAIRKQCPRL